MKPIESLQYQEREYQKFLVSLSLMKDHLSAIEFSDEVHLNSSLGSCWIYVKNRDDLQTAMTVVKGVWTKTTVGDEIQYFATREGIDYVIKATNDALPSTCKLVEEEYTIEAQPARLVKRLVVKCNEPISAD